MVCGLTAVEAVLWACVASTGLFVGCERPGSWVLGDDSMVESAPALCWFAVLWERALSFRRPLAQHSFGGWLCPQWGVSRAEVATLCRVVSCDLHLPERHSCWRVCNSGDGAVPGSPIAGSTCLGSEAVALCGTIFVLCSSCASGTSSALAGDSGKGVFAGQSDCRQHLFGG